jgi:hypothetical protein
MPWKPKEKNVSTSLTTPAPEEASNPAMESKHFIFNGCAYNPLDFKTENYTILAFSGPYKSHDTAV